MAAAALEGHFPWSCASVREVGAPGFPDAARKRFRYAATIRGLALASFAAVACCRKAAGIVGISSEPSCAGGSALMPASTDEE